MALPPRQPAPDPYGPYRPGASGGYPPAYGYVGPPPPRRRTGLVVGIVLAVVAMIGVGIGGYLLFLRPAGQNGQAARTDPEQVIQGFARSYTSLAHTLSAADLATVDSYLCAADQQAMRVIYDHQRALHATDGSFAMRTSDLAISDQGGTFRIMIMDHGTVAGSHEGRLVRQRPGWLVCDTVAPPH